MEKGIEGKRGEREGKPSEVELEEGGNIESFKVIERNDCAPINDRLHLLHRWAYEKMKEEEEKEGL